jgi:hypothetical protein
MTITAKGDTFEYEDTTALKKDALLVVPISAIPAGSATIGSVNALNGSAHTPVDSNANASFTSRLLDSAGAARASLGVAPYVYNGTTWDRVRKSNATSRIPSAAASTNATSAKASAGDLHCISGYNAAATVRYLKFYAKATAPTVGTDTPVITLALPPTSAFNINMNGHYIATGIAYAMTTGAADADTGALTAADIVGLTITYA